MCLVLLVELDITGLDLKDPRSLAAQEWDKLVASLNSTDSDPTRPRTSCGYKEDEPDKLLLIIENQPESEVRFVLSSFSALLSTPPVFLPVISSSGFCSPGYSFQQAILYIPASEDLKQFFLVLQIVFDPIQNRDLARDFHYAQVSGLVDFKGQQCHALMLAIKWDHGWWLTPANCGNEKDAEIIRRKSIRWALMGDNEIGKDPSIFRSILGIEERNWHVDVLKSFVPPKEAACAVM